tara:strand:- start:201 stop:638 length:438 start_codon:yes stop_codon:yes gene_type:complete
MRRYLWAAALLFLGIALQSCSSEVKEDPLAFCEKLLAIASPEAPLNTYDFDNAESITQALDDLKALALNPPDEIFEETLAVTNLFEAILKTLVSVSPNDRPDALQQFQVDIDETKDSTTTLVTYAVTECGVIFDGVEPEPITPNP